MNRLQKKCMIFSGALHGLLVLVLLFGAALMPRQEAAPFQRITLYSLPTDSPTSGGTPIVQQAAPPSPHPPTQQQQAPDRVPTPTPPTPPRPVVQRTPQKPVMAEPAPRPRPTLNPNELKVVKRNDSTTPTPTNKKPADTSAADAAAAAAANAAAVAAERARVQNAVSGALHSINDGAATSSAVNIAPGIGEGPLMANYRDIVASKYTAAWNPPLGLEDESATVTVTVTIARDGRVIRHEILKRSGNALMDKSIQTTLENVTFVEVFPAGSRDMQRTFTIKFNLAAKRMLG